jgi:hypothetical protein
MRNRFNYFIEVEERFVERRGAIRLLSIVDWALIESWQKAGIPLAAVLRGIDAAFDKYEAGRQRGYINSLAWCAQAVFSAAEELKLASTGTAPAGASVRAKGVEHSRVAAHLESAASILDLASIARELCAAAASRLRELAQEIRRSSKEDLDLETLECSLKLLEEDLFAALTACVPEDLRVCLKKRATRELMPYRDRMGKDQLRQVEDQFVRKQLLAHYNLPRFSLFYMESR